MFKPMLLVIALMLSACSTAPAPVVNYAANPPAIESAKTQMIDGFFKGELKDPESARYDWGVLEQKECYVRMLSMEKAKIWTLPVSVNAKNGFGAYTGAKFYRGFFVDSLLKETSSAELLIPSCP